MLGGAGCVGGGTKDWEDPPPFTRQMGSVRRAVAPRKHNRHLALSVQMVPISGLGRYVEIWRL